ncbi:MAG TPA: hypothetical protein VJS65_04825 [Verrucomicrobiae bacterium]|nr:hypothetical protein [Verrucomicrobiae bacterium]
MSNRLRLLFSSLVASLALTLNPFGTQGAPFGNAFTYQGRLGDGAAGASGRYDFMFRLFDSPGGTSQIGPTLSIPNVAVSNGLFTTTLDFGTGIFNGTACWLDVGVKSNGLASFTPLTPRQNITPSPYALYAAGAGNAGTATAVANNSVTSGSVLDLSLTASDIAPIKSSNPSRPRGRISSPGWLQNRCQS